MAGEFEIINKYFLPLTKASFMGSKAADNLSDDVATINIKKNRQLVVSKDLMVEDIHFKRSDGAYNIALKLLQSNLSDLAASGANPLYYLLGLAKSSDIDEKFIGEFCQGLNKIGEKYQLSLIGGDSVSTSNKLFFSITIFGEIKKGHTLKRNAAQDQDLIFVSGFIGDAFLGLNILQNKIHCPSEKFRNYLVKRHLNPTPRVELGKSLVKNRLAKSAIDVSDGLLADLRHICQSSKLSATVYQEQIPLSKAARFCLKHNPDLTISDLISAGDDYELIFSTRSKKRVENLSKKLRIPLSYIGFFKKNLDLEEINLLDSSGQRLPILKYGYQHY